MTTLMTASESEIEIATSSSERCFGYSTSGPLKVKVFSLAWFCSDRTVAEGVNTYSIRGGTPITVDDVTA